MKVPTHGKNLSEINIIPLVDVMLVLLIVFMVAAPLLEQGIDVNLPTVTAAPIERTESDIILTIDKKGQLFLADDPDPYTLEALREKLPAIYARREKKEIFIRADERIDYGTVAKTIGMFKNVGIERVGMVTEEEDVKKHKGG